MSRCKSCGAEIIWIKMVGTGKLMPCDAAPISYKTVLPGIRDAMALVTKDGRVTRGLFDPDSKQIGYVSHFATCPNANNHRR